MKAVDTNVIARYIVRDNAEEALLAERILAKPCYVPITVLLELGWLLSSRYRMVRTDVAATITDIIALPTVSVHDAFEVNWAIERYREGADIADMLHLIASRPADAFVTFDTGIAPAGGPSPPIPIETIA